MPRLKGTRLLSLLLILITVISMVGSAFAYDVLKYGDRGSEVIALQTKLNSKGFSCMVDGIYGESTVAAVKAFQKACGLKTDGKAGNQTQTALYGSEDKKIDEKTYYKTLRPGDKGDEVRKLQYYLKQKNCYKGNVDGIYSVATKNAVKAFQAKNGITVDGIAGYKTQTLLFNGKVPIDKTISEDESIKVHSANSMYYGCSGQRVKCLQKALKAAGCYSGKLDGFYGQLTKEAVMKYQRKKGLAVDGIAGTKTIASLNKTTKVSISSGFLLSIGSKGDEVYTVSAFLRGKGFMFSTTSVYNETMQNAVKTWQAATGKTVTGTITESQYNKIILGKEN